MALSILDILISLASTYVDTIEFGFREGVKGILGQGIFGSGLFGIFSGFVLIISSVIYILFTLAAVGAAAYVIFEVFDSWLLAEKTGIGTVIGGNYTPQRTASILMMTGYVMVPVMIPFPENYNLDIDMEGGICSISVTRDVYYGMRIGNSVKTVFVTGRISKECRLKSVSK